MLTRSTLLLATFTLLAAAADNRKVIVLIGPPAAGKSTQAEYLSRTYGLTIVAAQQLIQENRGVFAKYKNPNVPSPEPETDPALNRVIERALRKLDLEQGLVLDGFPNTVHQGEFLEKLSGELGLSSPLVIHLKVPDEVVKKRYDRQNPALLEQQLKDYHRELDFARAYFPSSDLHEIDGTLPRAKVSQAISKLVGPPPARK